MPEVLPRKTVLPKIEIPLVKVSIPAVELPPFPPKIPKLDDRQMEVLRYAVMEDVSDVVPVVGDAFADIAYKELVERLTVDEYEAFLEANKYLPSTLAAIKVFAEK